MAGSTKKKATRKRVATSKLLRDISPEELQKEWSAQLKTIVDLGSIITEVTGPFQHAFNELREKLGTFTEEIGKPVRDAIEVLERNFGKECAQTLSSILFLNRFGNRAMFERDIEGVRRLWRNDFLRCPKLPVREDEISGWCEWLDKKESRLASLGLQYNAKQQQVEFIKKGKGKPRKFLTELAKQFLVRTKSLDTCESRERMAHLLSFFFDIRDLGTRANDPIGVAFSTVERREKITRR